MTTSPPSINQAEKFKIGEPASIQLSFIGKANTVKEDFLNLPPFLGIKIGGKSSTKQKNNHRFSKKEVFFLVKKKKRDTEGNGKGNGTQKDL